MKRLEPIHFDLQTSKNGIAGFKQLLESKDEMNYA